MNVPTITPHELQVLCNGGRPFDLIDVRTPIEFQEIHVTGARNWPLDQIDPARVMASRQGASEEPLYVICRSGSRGSQACAQLLAAGYDNVRNVEGGTLACVAAGLSVVRGRKMMSLERQVRITAGSFVLLGVLLAWLVHPVFLALAGFVGAGLVFAGVTDTCGMGLLLARMPWNRVASVQDSCPMPSVPQA